MTKAIYIAANFNRIIFMERVFYFTKQGVYYMAILKKVTWKVFLLLFVDKIIYVATVNKIK
jgi:hypothetical protein